MGTFLIVDNSRFMRDILRKIITSDGHLVVGEASNGYEAFEQYKKLHPEVVIMDIVMDNADGIQGLKLIKEYDPAAVVIMCSAMGEKCLVVEAVQSGAKEFITKPFTRDAVLDVIKNIVK